VSSGLEDYLALQQSPRRAPAIIGCAPWLSDKQLVDQILHFGNSCIVINKPERVGAEPTEVKRLHDQGNGFPAKVLPEFQWLAPSEDGEPAIVGPSSYDPAARGFKSVRVAGVSKQDRSTVPLVHAKMLLLGATVESEGEFGEQIIRWESHQAWLGSANFTFNSRRSVEFGLWVTDSSLLALVTRFLSDLFSYSEVLDSYQLNPNPEWIPYEFDDAAIFEYLAEHSGEFKDDE
jgi:hypothetical protein